MGYVFVPYPSWRYHRVESPRIVQNEVEDKALGPGWRNAPFAADEPTDPAGGSLVAPAVVADEPPVVEKRGPGRPRKDRSADVTA